MNIETIGRRIRKQRKLHGLRQAELAAISDVGTRFVSELENGKPSLEIGRVLQVLDTLGLTMGITPKNWESILSLDNG